MPPSIGIYKIVHKRSKKYYVGSSLNLPRRWKDHKRDLNKNEHCNDYLQNAWKKYGSQEFEFLIIKILPPDTTSKQLLDEEQKWLDIAVSDPLTYNLTFIAGCPTAHLSDYSKKKRAKSLRKVVRTKEWKEKISKSHMGIRPNATSRKKMSLAQKGKKQTKQHKENAADSHRKHWDFISPDGKQVHIYDLKRFSRENNLNSGRMYDVANGKRRHHKQWKAFPPIIFTKYKPTKSHIQRAAEGHAKDFVFLSPTKSIVYVHNLAKFCRENNLSAEAMGRVFHGKTTEHRGWTSA